MSKSEYEVVREQNIARNAAFLSSIGLDDVKPVKKRAVVEDTSKTRSRSKRQRATLESTRRSERLSNTGDARLTANPSFRYDDKNDTATPNTESSGKCSQSDDRKRVTAKALRELIEKTDSNHNRTISNEAVALCCQRLASMSEQALLSRIKTIAKAQGKNSYEKLLVFRYGLQAAGFPSHADYCKQAMQLLGRERRGRRER